MSETDELKQALDELAGVQLIDNTWQEAEAVRREITGIIQALHRDLCTASTDLQEREGLRFQVDQCKKSRERNRARAEAAEAEAVRLRERQHQLEEEVRSLVHRISAIDDVLDSAGVPESKNERYDGRGEIESADSMSVVERIQWMAGRCSKAADLRQQLADQAAEASAACQEWDAECQRLEAEAAELRRRLTERCELAGHCQHCYAGSDLPRRLATAEAGAALVPEAELLEMVVENGVDSTVAHELCDLADRIRAWRGDGDGGEEGSDGD